MMATVDAYLYYAASQVLDSDLQRKHEGRPQDVKDDAY